MEQMREKKKTRLNEYGGEVRRNPTSTYGSVSYCQREEKQSKLRTENWVESTTETNKQKRADSKRIKKVQKHILPFHCIFLSEDTLNTLCKVREQSALLQVWMMLLQARWCTIQRQPAHTTEPELGRNPHMHFLAPPLPQTVWNVIIGSQWNPCPISKYSPVGLHRTGSNLQAPVQMLA